MKTKSIKHWIVLFCCCALAASSVGSVVNTVGIFYEKVSQDLGVLRGTFALHATVMTLTIAIVSLLIPKFIGKVHFKSLILIGALMVLVSSIMMSFGNAMSSFYIAAVIKGIGASIYNILLITMIINHWFKEKNGLAISITLSFSGLAGAVLSPFLNSCILNYGWRTSYIILGIISFVLCLPALIYPFHMNPREDGLLPYGFKEEEIEVKVQTDNKKNTFHAGELNFIIFIMVCILFTAITGLSSHLPSYALSLGITSSVGALMLSASMIGNIISKFLVGALSDKLGIIKSVFTMMVIIGISMILLMFVHVKIMMIIASLLYGACYSIAAVGISLLTKLFFHEDNYVKAYSIVSFATNFGSAFSMSLFGYVYDFTNSYYIVFIMIIGILIINSLGLIVCKKLSERN